ncbi:uncharacterized protein LOC119390500 [Rhipicephalus sanguineus]|uniref:uncharacterized protein LOC119390500 n=1 Tax=Rhipicephalus sanguineus TaxID=34632 RepID=UPI001896082A|nr:uncharacterized protein LOC119390500 [Rhipicephalus sanguineus]
MPLPFTKQLSLANIMGHLETSEKRIRCLVEGEEVLNAGHLICCGVKACSVRAVSVQALCLQTSHVRGKPHEVEFVFDVSSHIKGHCSCKAGNSERCKHIIAMLLHVNRTGIQNLDLLTSTDVTQAWGKLKTSPLYEACKLKRTAPCTVVTAANSGPKTTRGSTAAADCRSATECIGATSAGQDASE